MFNQQLKPVKNKEGLWGFTDAYDEVKIDFLYGYAEPFSEGLALVGAWPMVNGVRDTKAPLKYGYLSEAGRFEIKPQFLLKPFPFKDGVARINVGEEDKPAYSFINKKGERLFKEIFNDVSDFGDGIAKTMVHDAEVGKLVPAYIDKSGRELFRVVQGEIGPFCSGLARRRLKRKWGYVDPFGKTVIPMIFGAAGDFAQGRAAVGENGRFGYINSKGKVVIPLEYDEVKAFSDGLAAVRRGKLWGYITSDGEIAIEHQYFAATPFKNGQAMVRAVALNLLLFKFKKWIKIDKKGRPADQKKKANTLPPRDIRIFETDK